MNHAASRLDATGSNWAPWGLALLTLVPTLGGLARLASFAGGPSLPDGDRFAGHPIVLAVHVVSALTFALGGAMQFSSRLRRRPAVHRAIGRVVLPAGLVGALSGLATMLAYTPAAADGTPLRILRAAAGLAMLVLLLTGLAALLRRDYHAHGRWMTRAYAFGAAPGVQALVLLPLALAGVDTETSFTAGMAIGWAVSIAVAESVVRRAPERARPSMNAIVYDRYGGPEELYLSQVPRPTPAPGEVRVRVEASSLNAADRRMLRADPFLVRLANGFFRPRARVLGVDVAGVVDAVGPGVVDRRAGDRVFGQTSIEGGLGGFAEHVCLPEGSVAELPHGLDARAGAALPLAAQTALQAVRERGRLGPGMRVLVDGAGGGVGAYLVQIAKAYGTHVTAVAGSRSLDRIRALGADRVVDRGAAALDERFDVVFGVNGYRPLREHFAHLVPNGRYVMVGGDSRQLFEALLFGSLRARFAGRRLEVLTMDMTLLPKDLAEIRDLVAHGSLRPVVDRIVPLRDVADAMRALESGGVAGKIVLDAEGLAAA